MFDREILNGVTVKRDKESTHLLFDETAAKHILNPDVYNTLRKDNKPLSLGSGSDRCDISIGNDNPAVNRV